MPEKKDQGAHRHAWPPEAITCYMPTYFVLKEQEAGRNIYTLVRVASGKPSFVIRTSRYADLLEAVIQDATIPVFSVTPRQLIEGSFGEPQWRYNSGDDAYTYDFAKRPTYFLKPDFEEREEYEPKPEEAEEEASATQALVFISTPSSVFDDYCQTHKRRKQKDGHSPGSKKTPPRQKYQCPDCKSGKPPAQLGATPQTEFNPKRTAPTRTHDERGALDDCYLDYCTRHRRPKVGNGEGPRGTRYRCAKCVRENRGNPRGGARPSKGHHHTAQAASVQSKVSGNPKCQTCGEYLRVSSRSYNPDHSIKRTYWYCIKNCPITGHEAPGAKDRLPDTFDEVPPIVEKYVKRLGGFRPQDLPDIVQQISMFLWQRALKISDLNDKVRLRGIIAEVIKGYQDEYAPKGGASKSLDAPIREDLEGCVTRADFEPAPEAESNPYQQLEAKEAVEARLRRQPSAPPDELIAHAAENARVSD